MTLIYENYKSAVLMLLLLGTSQAQAANLASHRAVYDVVSEGVADKAEFTSIVGRMVYEVQGSACEGYAVVYRIANRYSERSGGEKIVDSQMTSFEAGDATDFQIKDKLFINSVASGDTTVSASRKTALAEVEGVVNSGKEKAFKLAADTMFPMQHLAHVLDKAAKGEVRDSSLLFEGTELEKSHRVITSIAKMKTSNEVALPKGDFAGALSKLKAWPLTMSYYPFENEQAEEPLYQSDFLMFENGVTASLHVTYPTHQIRAVLTGLEILPQESCK
jgi:EipB-like